jgi:hypothetical protein
MLPIIKGKSQDNDKQVPSRSVSQHTQEPPPELRHPSLNPKFARFAPRVGLTPPSSPQKGVTKHASVQSLGSIASTTLDSSSSAHNSPNGESFTPAFQSFSPRSPRGSNFIMHPVSPLATPTERTTAAIPFPLLNEGADDINVRRVRYEPLESSTDSDASFASFYSLSTFNTNDGDADPELVAGLPIEFLDRMFVLSQSNFDLYVTRATLLSFRIQKPDLLPNRRQSLMINDRVIAAPKTVPTATTNNTYYCICGGHIPRDQAFLLSEYIPLDNNIPGTFSDEVISLPNNLRLLEYYRKHMSLDILEVKVFEGLICFSEHVPRYEEYTDIAGNKKFRKLEGQYNINYFMQESRTLDALFELFKLGICEFEYAADGKVYFTERNKNKCMIDLSKTIPNIEHNYPIYSIDSYAEFMHFTNFMHELATQISPKSNFHTPVFYLQNGEELPVMLRTGIDGNPITSDADAYINGIPIDIPTIAIKTFNGARTSSEVFITGLEILLARLTCETFEEYYTFVEVLKSKLPTTTKVFAAYPQVFAYSDCKYWIQYNQDEYYVKEFIPRLKATLEYFKSYPQRLRTVGESNLIDLVLLHAFNHPLYVHGTEAMHPKSRPGEDSAIVACFNGKFAIIKNVKSYIAYLLHDQQILSTQLILIHPHWLGDLSDGAYYADAWLDILSIQALNKSLDDSYDAMRAEHEFRCYWEMLVNTLSLGRKSEETAFRKINTRMQMLQDFLKQSSFDADVIRQNIAKYYLKYDLEIAQVRRALDYTPNSPRISSLPA